MLNLGNVVVDSTIRIPFNSFDAAGESITLTGFAVGDIKVFKDAETSARSSTSGFTADTDFQSITGAHQVIIDLSDTTVANYYETGSTYNVAIDSVDIDGETVRFWVGRFTIEPVSVGSRIKNIQHVEITVADGDYSEGTTITSVDWDNTELRLRGFRCDQDAANDGLASCMVAAYYTTSTTVRIIRERNVGDVRGYIDVVEWE